MGLPEVRSLRRLDWPEFSILGEIRLVLLVVRIRRGEARRNCPLNEIEGNPKGVMLQPTFGGGDKRGSDEVCQKAGSDRGTPFLFILSHILIP
jgi:hypothetical protein